MRIVIVEDEKPIAGYIERLCRDILGAQLKSLTTLFSLESAGVHLLENPIDLCLLDLNLNGEDGYELLKLAVAGSFHTIIISAYPTQAIEAFHYGVLDFIEKPFDKKRLIQAFDRYFERRVRQQLATKYIAVRKNNRNVVIAVDDIMYLKAADVYVDAHLKDGTVEILDKTMDRLNQILPRQFMRVHRSCFVDIAQIAQYEHIGGGVYRLTTRSGAQLPLSRSKYKELQELFNHNPSNSPS